MADAVEHRPETGEARETQHLVSSHYDTRVRDLSLSKRIQAPLLAGATIAFARTIGPTWRFDVLGEQHVMRVHASGRRVIYAFSHRGLFPLLWWARNRGTVVLSSTNFDGEWSSRAVRGMGFKSARGSSTRGGLKGLLRMAEIMAEGYDAGFAVDGPRGPRFIAKPGPVLLARRTKSAIIALHVFSESAYTFEKAWDLFQVPYPFSRVSMVHAPPVEVPSNADRDTIEHKHAELQQQLDRARETAENWFRLSANEQAR